MLTLFLQPWWLLLLPFALTLVALRYRHAAQASSVSTLARRRLRLRALLQTGTILSLILAAADLQKPSWSQRTQLIIAADVSPSIIDPQPQNQWMKNLCAQLNSHTTPQETEVGVVIFSANAATERPLHLLPEPSRDREPHLRRASSSAAVTALPDLSHPATVVDKRSTNLAGAIECARSLLADRSGGRAIVLLSDFLDTHGHSKSAAAALSTSGIDLLVAPVAPTENRDVRLAALRVPDRSRLNRPISIEVTVAAQAPVEVEVKILRRRIGQSPQFIDSCKLKLEAADFQTGELHQTIRFVDPHTEGAGVVTYLARVSRLEGDAFGDVTLNNQLAAAVRIDDTSSRWAVLTRKGSTLEALCLKKSLGVETQVYTLELLPKHGLSYTAFEGILIDGLSAAELSETPLKALSEAARNGKSIVALGGPLAFGAGAHPRDGAFEQLLPILMTPEDDRTRSILFLMDISSSMNDVMGGNFGKIRKLDFAADQLAQAVQRLKEQDRLGLITFSGSAQLASALSSEPRRESFLNAVKKAHIESSTDMLAPILKSKEVLAKDDAEERLVMLLSDGKKTVDVPDEQILQAAKDLCPPDEKSQKDNKNAATRRTSLYTFGIAARPSDTDDQGEALLKSLANAGGGKYSADFTHLGDVVEKAFAQKKDFFVRHEPFVPKVSQPHSQNPIVSGISAESYPILTSRNRVKARAGTETLLLAMPSEIPSADTVTRSVKKNRPDPLIVLSSSTGSGLARSAVIALSLDGPDGTTLLNSKSGSRLLSAVLEWAEDREDTSSASWELQVDATSSDELEVTLRAKDKLSGVPLNGKRLSLQLTPLIQTGTEASPASESTETIETPLPAAAPGLYRTHIPAPSQGIYRATLKENSSTITERFVTVPYPAEYRRFGTDRATMSELAHLAGGHSKILEQPKDIASWLKEVHASKENMPLAPLLCLFALVLSMLEITMRYMKTVHSS